LRDSAARFRPEAVLQYAHDKNVRVRVLGLASQPLVKCGAVYFRGKVNPQHLFYRFWTILRHPEAIMVRPFYGGSLAKFTAFMSLDLTFNPITKAWTITSLGCYLSNAMLRKLQLVLSVSTCPCLIILTQDKVL